MMISLPLSTIQLQRMLRACIYAVLLCAFFGVVSDARAQSKTVVCRELDMSTADCDRITNISTTPPDTSAKSIQLDGSGVTVNSSVPWIRSSFNTQGGTSMRSGRPGHSRASCLVLTAALPEDSMISFAQRIDAQRFDALSFAAVSVSGPIDLVADRFIVSTVSGSRVTPRDWERFNYTLERDVRALYWCYGKDRQDSRTPASAEDSAWVDDLSFTVPFTTAEVCSALDMSTEDCALITGFSTTLPSGVTLPQEGASATQATNVPWYVSSVRTEGANSLRSGDVGHAQGSCLVLAVPLPTNTRIRFSLRISAQRMYDRLAFFAGDETVISNFSAPRSQGANPVRDWTEQEHRLTASASNLSWCYLKNGGDTTEGDDSGWLDDLSFVFSSPVCPALDMSDEECDLISDTRYELLNSPSRATLMGNPTPPSWTVNNFATLGGTSLVTPPGIALNLESCLVLDVRLPGRILVQFFRRVNAAPTHDLYFSVDAVRQEYSLRPAPTTVIRNWSREVHILPDSGGDKTLRWCYAKNNNLNKGADNARIDDLSLVAPHEAPLNRELACLVLDMSLEDCNRITSVASEPENPSWFISSINSEGGASLRSNSMVGDNETSCLVLGIALPSNRNLRFSLRTDSEAVNDFVYLEADGVRLIDNFSARSGFTLRDFEQLDVLILSSVRTLKWCYTKNGSLSPGDDSGWLDTLSFTPVDNTPLNRELVCQALDLSPENCALIRTLSFDPPQSPWVLSNTATEGSISLRSGSIGDNQQSCLVLNLSPLTGQTLVQFELRISSEPMVDRLRFSANGQLLDYSLIPDEDTVLREYRTELYFVPAGTTQLSWCYRKNNSGTEGEDSAWIDDLSFTLIENAPVSRELFCLALDLSSEDCARISALSFNPPQSPWILSGTALDGSTSLRSGNISHDQSSCLVLALGLPANAEITVAARTISEGQADHLRVLADMQLIDAISADAGSSERGWAVQRYYLPDDISALSWCYVKDSANTVNPDRAWIDSLSFGTSGITYQDRICDTLDLTDSDCAMIDSIVTDRDYLWAITAETNDQGGTSLRSRGTFNNLFGGDRNCFSISLRQPLPGPTRIHYSRRISAELNSTRLVLGINGVLSGIDGFTAESNVLRDWEQGQFVIPDNVTSLDWCYIKDGTDAAGADSIWIDALSFVTPEVQPLCDTLDMPPSQCAMIRSVSYDPPQRLWLTTTDAFIGGNSALVSPPLAAGQSACLTIDIDNTLPSGSYLAFGWRATGTANQDILEFQAGSRQSQISNMPQWQVETVLLGGSGNTLRWCYRFNSAADGQTSRAWLDSLLPVPVGDRYVTQLTVTRLPALLGSGSNNFRLQVTVIAVSATLPPPVDWALTASGIDNIAADTIYPLVFSNNLAQVEVIVTPANPLLPASGRIALDDQSLLPGAAVTSLTYMLPARELDMLNISVPDSVTQTDPDAVIDIVIDVTASDNLGNLFNPIGLALMTGTVVNANLLPGNYALTFTAGTARTTVTVELTRRGRAGSIDVSVSSGATRDNASITLNPTPIQLAVLAVVAPAAVTQSTPGAMIGIPVTVTATDNYGNPFEPAGLMLAVSSLGNARVLQSMYALSFAAGTAQPAITVGLIDRDIAGSVEVSVVSGNISDSAVVGLNPAVRQLTQFSVTAPQAVTQSTPGATLDIVVTVTARDNFELPFNPADLELMVADSGNANVPQSTYALTFAAGTAQATITVGLISRGNVGSIEVSVTRGNIQSTTSITLDPTPIQLAVLAVVAPAAVTQSTPGAMIAIPVTVTATDNYGNSFAPEGLVLLVEAVGNARVLQSTYALRFADSTAQATVTVGLTDRDVAGSIRISVSSGTISDSASVGLNPAVRLLTQLQLTAPAAVTQSTPGATIDIGVTVTASDNFELPFNPADLELMVADSGNASVPQSTYALTFVGGTAQTTVTVGLIDGDIAGSIEVSVNRGEVSDSASVGLNPAVRLLTQLSVTAPETETQTAPGAAIDIVVTVAARDNFELLFNPVGLELMVSGTDNASVLQSTYALTFTDGTAQTTVTVDLTVQGSTGSIAVSVSRGDIQSTASVTLNPVVRLLTQLSVTAPAAVTQTAPDAAIDIAVTVTVRDNFELLFEPTGLTLVVSDTGNASVSQSNYALTFTDGTAETTVTVGLISRGDVGSIEVSVISGDIQSTASITLDPTPIQLARLAIVVADGATQSTPGAMIAIPVTVTATDNYGNSFAPEGLELSVTNSGNASVSQSTYALTFAAGTAQATVTVDLIDKDSAGSIELSVSRGDISDTASVGLNPAGRLLAQLSVTAPAAVTQSEPDAAIEIGVTVTASDNFELPFNPANLELMVSDTGNASVSPNNYPLSFAAGTAQTTITVGLTSRGEVGSIEVSVVSGDIQSTASITLNPTPVVFAMLSITAPAVLSQTAPGAAIDLAVTVIARDNYGLLFNPAGLMLVIDSLDNASVSPNNYPLTFAGGTARTTITVSLTNESAAGSIEISVSSGTITDSAVVNFTPPGRELTQLAVVAAAVVTQSVPYTTINIVVTVTARDNFDLPFDPPGLTLRVEDSGNARVLQSSYALTFTAGMVDITVDASLTDPFSSGSIELSVASGDIQSTASITLNPTPVRLAALSITAPRAVMQSTPDVLIAIPVTVTATDNYGRPFEPPGLTLTVAGSGNASVPQDSYALSFAAGTAQTTITVGLTGRDIAGSIELSVSSGTVSDSAAVDLNPALRLLTQLLVTAPAAVTQSTPDATIEIGVTVTASDNFELSFEPTGLTLMVSDTGNANILQSSYALTFVNGTAETTVMVGLTLRGAAGSIDVSVVSGDIQSTASITLNPTPIQLAVLAVIAPAGATQSTPGAVIAIAVTVTALDNYGSLFEPAGLELLVEDSGNASVSQSTYVLTFENGTAETTITVDLINRDIAGSIELSVSSGDVRDSAAVDLNPAVRLLTQLSVTAPAAVTQSAPDATIDIGVTVTASDNFELPFNPANLTLMVSGAENAELLPGNYALTFAAGTAQTTITVSLTSRGDVGSIEVSVVSGTIQSTASITLDPAPIQLAALAVAAPAAVTQSTPGAVIAIAVTVTATDNYGSPFEPASLALLVANTGNANLLSGSYPLTFENGTARTTIAVGLISRGVAGSIEVSVARGDIQSTASITLSPTPIQLAVLAIVAPAGATQSTPGAVIEIAVTVTADDNYGDSFTPQGLELSVANSGNASVSQSTYALTFAANMAQTTITVGLINRDIAGSIELSVNSGDVSDVASVGLNPAVRLLTQLSVTAPATVNQSAADAAIDIGVTVAARDNFDLPFNPDNLELMVSDTGNASVSPNNYPLTFTAGTAETTITVGLTRRGNVGSIEVSVTSGTIQSAASIALNPTPVRLERLAIVVVDDATQSTPGAVIEIPVTVTAEDNYGDSFTPQGLELSIANSGNASVSQSTYALTFAANMAQTTITVGLIDRDIAGSIELSVNSGDVSGVASVGLNPALRLLTQLQLTAPTEVTQSTPDAAIDIGVTVAARDNFELLFNPVDLELMVEGTGNASVSQSTYALTFAGGTAETTITVELANRGEAGSIEVSVTRGDIQSAASIALNPTPVRLERLAIVVADDATQSTPGATIEIPVTVTALDNYGDSFAPEGLELSVTNSGNASVSQSTYALSFAADMAQTTITVGLINRDIAGSIELSVNRGDVSDVAAVELNPAVRLLTQLQLTAPTEVTQSAPDAAIDIGVTVTARDNFDLPSNPAGLELMVSNTGNANLLQSTYALTFAAGTAETVITVELTNRGDAGSIEVSIIGSAIESNASITLNPTPVVFAMLSITAPAVLSQSAPGAAIDLAVTVIARDNYGLLFNPAGLMLVIDNLDNASVSPNSYPLTFAAGTARTTITVSLTDENVAGSLEVSVSSGTITDSAVVNFTPPGRQLTQLAVVAAAVVTQSVPYTTINIVVTVTARDNFDLPFDPPGLELRVEDSGNARVLQSRYALTFTAGMVDITVNASLTDPFSPGSIEVSVASGDIQSTASITLNPTPVRLAALAIVAPAAVMQSTPDVLTAIAVTVTATDNYGRPFEPPGLTLTVAGSGNASIPQGSYALAFTAGTAETTIMVGLTGRDVAGSIELSVSSGDIQSTTSVTLNPALRVLTQLSVMAATAVTQSAPDATIDIAVTVAARDNFDLTFDPTGLELMVSGTGNANLLQSTYALTFAAGTAETTITVGLTNRGAAGSIEVSVASGDIQSTASITLNPTPIRLAALSITAPRAVTQSTPGTMTAIAVTVTATDNYGNSIDPVDLELRVAGSGNARVPQSTYALSFAAGMAQTTITVGLTGRDIAGIIELSVASGTVSDSASVDLNPALRVLTQLAVTAPAAVTQSEPDATIDIGVTVNARDNFDLTFEPLGLELRVTDTGNANLLQSTYALTFAAGTAETTITVGLTRRGAAGSIEVSVASGDIQSTASITLNPTPIRLAVLSIDVPEAVAQSALDALIEIAVTVTADDNYGNPIDPAELLLSIAGSGNASVPQSTYALTFAGGIAETTITVGLIGRDIAGILELSVSSGTVSGVAEVQLIPPGERLLAQLAVMAPAVVTQSVPYTTIDIAVTVAAIDNFDLPFGPPGLTLMVSTDTSNVRVLQSSYALTFTAGMAVVTVNAELIDPFSSGSIEVSVASGDIESTASITLNPAPVQLAVLAVVAAAAVTQSTPDAMIAIPVTVTATDNYGRPFDPERLELSVADSGNARVLQSTYALTFTAGTAQTTITVGLTSRGSPGSIEVSVASGTVSDSASVTLNPAPRVLVSVSLAAASSNLVQTVANTAVAADLILTALDNYGDLFEAGDIRVQLSASAGAVVPSSLTLTVESSGTVQQAVEILPQNDLDTIVTVQILRDALDQAVQLLPNAGIQITVQALRVLRQLQLSLADQVSPLQQIDQSLPILANIRLTGLDQYDQPIAFAGVMLTATAEPTTTVVTLNPQQLSTTVPGEAVTVLRVVFPEPLDTMITIAIANPGAGVTAPELIIQALPESRPPIRPLDVDNTGTGVTELDLVVALRWLASQQVSTASLVVNLTITPASITAEGIKNLQQLFTENSDRIDFNKDGRADQLDLRILLRYMAGLRGTALTEQELSADAIRIIRLLLGQP